MLEWDEYKKEVYLTRIIFLIYLFFAVVLLVIIYYCGFVMGESKPKETIKFPPIIITPEKYPVPTREI